MYNAQRWSQAYTKCRNIQSETKANSHSSRISHKQKHSSYTTMPQHYTQNTGNVTFHWRIYKLKTHAWHIVLSTQTLGRGERGKRKGLITCLEH